ncbi:MAG: hypothetical protein JWM16_3951 [Verrucomicrobiales bacterium]|nr:hypothetical protein [Verrucomicrobiales bacterium]
MNIKALSGAASERALAAKLEELLRGVDWLRGWQVEQVGGVSDAGFDLLATVPLPGRGQGGAMSFVSIEGLYPLPPYMKRNCFVFAEALRFP